MSSALNWSRAGLFNSVHVSLSLPLLDVVRHLREQWCRNSRALEAYKVALVMASAAVETTRLGPVPLSRKRLLI